MSNRVFIPQASPGTDAFSVAARDIAIRIASYNVMSQTTAAAVMHCSLTWAQRCDKLLAELLGVSADVLCLQDVDDWEQWWRPRLAAAGYDSSFKSRTASGGRRRDGCAVCWQRERFQVCRSDAMELDKLAVRERDAGLACRAARTGCIAVFVLLQPWGGRADLPQGLCLASAALHVPPPPVDPGGSRRRSGGRSSGGNGNGIGNGSGGSSAAERAAASAAVQLLQARGLLRTLEVFNADSQMPVILAGTIGGVPGSATAEAFLTGRVPHDPGPPAACDAPFAEPASCTSVQIRWAPPPYRREVPSDNVCAGYWVAWRPGGNKPLGFSERRFVSEAQCVVYDVQQTVDGGRRTSLAPLRSFLVTGLSSGLAYEFAVAATNVHGMGPLSPPGEPVTLPRFCRNEPDGRLLLTAEMLRRVRARQEQQGRHEQQGQDARQAAFGSGKRDGGNGGSSGGGGATGKPLKSAAAEERKERLRHLVPVPGLLELEAEEEFPCATASGLTARYVDGEENTAEATFRTVAGLGGGSASSHGRCGDGGVENGSRLFPMGRGSPSWGGCSLPVIGRRRSAPAADFACGNSLWPEPELEEEKKEAKMVAGTTASGWTDAGEFAVVADGLRQAGARGDRDPARHAHSLALRSAYGCYGAAGEPRFTTCTPAAAATVDYILYSAEGLAPTEVLALPEIHELAGFDVREAALAPDAAATATAPAAVGVGGDGDRPEDWCDEHWGSVREGEDAYEGMWAPALAENPARLCRWLPNETYPSDHLMLAATLRFVPATSATGRPAAVGRPRRE